jgi:hypothetical protein
MGLLGEDLDVFGDATFASLGDGMGLLGEDLDVFGHATFASLEKAFAF